MLLTILQKCIEIEKNFAAIYSPKNCRTSSLELSSLPIMERQLRAQYLVLCANDSIYFALRFKLVSVATISRHSLSFEF